MERAIKQVIVSMVIFVVVMVVATISYGHKYGHADDIFHLTKGERTGWIEKADWCWAGNTKQNKIVLYIDEDRDDIVELCGTIWYEHGMLHYILSDVDENDNCECQGYLWFDDDAQGEELWNYYEDWKLPRSD
jgi:hypothetical protein